MCYLHHMASKTHTLVDPTELVSVGDIARAYGISNAAVCNWKVRYADFPRPVATPGCGQLFLRPAVERWYDARHP